MPGKSLSCLLWLYPAYQVKSNRKSGYGRHDIMIIPGDVSKLGYVIEFKKVRKNETAESALESALNKLKINNTKPIRNRTY
ncbi:MAG: PD-(D/E)XK nuclease domain-containing protein [Acidobacteria bacterium]|nr:PD-(D/E)XK nuclease domain-containing protein [Acidobacteriota bacterium]